MVLIQGGSIANKNGNKLESYVEKVLKDAKLDYQKQVNYTGVYNKNSKMDFYIPSLDMAIEVKNQTGSGSVIEKIPYAIESLASFPAKKGLLVMGDVKSISGLQESFWLNKGKGCYDYAINKSKELNGIYVVEYQDLSEFIENALEELRG